jgi:glutamyl/glutaminyl-tRNA synthetase
MQEINSFNIEQQSARTLLDLIIESDTDFLSKIKLVNNDQLLKIIDLFRDRSTTLSEMTMHLRSICLIPVAYDSEYLDELITEKTSSTIELVIKKIESMPIAFEWNEESVTELIKSVCKEFDIKTSYLAHIIRLSLIGKSDGPGMYKMLSVLSKDDVIKRLKKFRYFIIEN